VQYLILLFFFLTVNSIYSDQLEYLEPKVHSLDNSNPERILFVGNSYLYYNDSLHNHLRRMVEEKNPSRKENMGYKSATIGGSILAHHDLKHLLDSKNIGIDQPFELVIIQGGSGEVLDEDSRTSFEINANKMIKQVKNKGGEALLYMIHPYMPPHELYDPKMIEKIRYTYINVGNKNNVLVAPIGLAYMNAYNERPDIKLHKSFDGSHPDLLGTYLAACVLYATIYKKSSLEVDYNYFDAVSLEDQKFLQTIADKTVNEFFDR
jgi:hypothetical protein